MNTRIRLDEELGRDAVRSLIYRYLKEMPDGMEETPARVLRAWDHMLQGYEMERNLQDWMTSFDGEQYSGIVLLANIEFYSTCEHHLLPFHGVGHVAYIPDQMDQSKVIGISKLARILETYARRFQMQERIAMQVVDCLEKYLSPLGSACILEGKHFCMMCRGVEKQNSSMVTSSMKGVFDTKPEARAELMQLIQMTKS